MNKEDFKKGVVYFHYGANGADGANILFSVAKDKSYGYKSCIIVHWKGNRFTLDAKNYSANEHMAVRVASSKATEYFNKCVKAGKDVGGFSWHDSNKYR